MKFPFFRSKSVKRELANVSPAPNILLCSPLKAQTRVLALEGVWRRVSLFGTINYTVRKFPSFFSDLPKVSFQFSEKKESPVGYLNIYCEHGWLPRDFYQISSWGVNQSHHAAVYLSSKEAPEKASLSLSDEDYRKRIEELRDLFGPLQPPGGLCDRPFFVFALQLTNDLNLRRSGTELAALADKKGASELIKKKLSALMGKANSAARILFLQHPSEEPGSAPDSLWETHEYVSNRLKLRAVDLMSSPNCRGVITINSNTLNEALLLGVPVFQLGNFLMPSFPNRYFPYSLEEFLEDPRRCRSISNEDQYLRVLLENQYDLESLKKPEVLRSLIETEMARKRR